MKNKEKFLYMYLNKYTNELNNIYKGFITLLHCNFIISVFVVFAIVKAVLLYSLTLGNSFFMLLIWTVPAVIAIYAAVGMYEKKGSFYILLCFHTIISIVMFADVMYYKYFGTLPSVYDMTQIKELKGVSDSIFSLFNPFYLLLFVDIIPIIYLYKYNKMPKNNYKTSKCTNRLIVVLCSVIIAFTLFVKTDNSYYIFEKYGVFSYHIYDILQSMANSSDFFQGGLTVEGQAEKEEKGKRLFGIAKNRNILLIQLEALQDFVIGYNYEGQEITPNLNRLIKENSIYFDRFYHVVNKGMTSDSEFAALNSMYPAIEAPTYKMYENNSFYALPQALKDNGYKEARALHGYVPEFWNRNVMYPKFGFDKFISQEDFIIDEVIGMGLSDESFFRASVKYLKEMKQPYFAFLITLSSHNPFKLPKSHQKIKLLDKHKDTMFGDYLQAVHYMDYSLGIFIEELKNAGLYDNSMLVLYGDHFGLMHKTENNEEIMSEVLGCKYAHDQTMNVPLIIHIPGADISEKKSIVGSQLDIYPTVLNLAGIEREKISIKLYGQDLLNTDKGFVALMNFLNRGSFIDDEKIFLMPSNCRFKEGIAWKLDDGSILEVEPCREEFERAKREIEEANYILKHDLIKEMLKQEE